MKINYITLDEIRTKLATAADEHIRTLCFAVVFVVCPLLPSAALSSVPVEGFIVVEKAVETLRILILFHPNCSTYLQYSCTRSDW